MNIKVKILNKILAKQTKQCFKNIIHRVQVDFKSTLIPDTGNRQIAE